MKSTTSLAVIASSFLLILGACSGNPPTTETEDAAASKASQTSEAGDAVDDFFKTIAKSDTDDLRSVSSELAAPGSLAAGYATHLANVNEADQDSGIPNASSEYRKSADGYATCGTDDAGEELCTKYSDLKTKGGKLATFAVNGVDLGERLTLGDGSTVSAGNLGKVELLSAYKSGLGDLYVVLKISSGGREISPYVNQALYRAPNGRQSTASPESSYIDGLAPNSSATMYAIFPRADVGGEVSLTLATNDTFEEAAAKIRIK